ncbi:hypothetical protein [Bacillus cereus]|uniref:hypothetical protein n=1 Tax=Bacillus cereus TaxID=1396 RepID=UPI000BF7AE9D|nr:hypothetical protein [Bacillus cereus]PFD67329.1 hypothetical protein CN301_28065 [Bacillus cereus]
MKENKLLFNKIVSLKNIKNEGTLRIYLYGYSSEIILSKDIFPSNKELIEFITAMGLEFRDYVYASRTVVVSRIIREIEKREMQDLEAFRDNLIEYFANKFEYSFITEKSRPKRETENYVKTIAEKYNRRM